MYKSVTIHVQDGKMKKATLKEVAGKAGVSVTMTSRVLGNYGSFGEETKKVVMKAAKELNYTPNVIARSLRAGNTKAIGVIVNSVVDSFWMVLFRGIEQTAMKEGYQVFLCDNDGGQHEKEKEYLKLLMERNIDGLILSPAVGSHPLLKKISRGGLPIVLIETKISGLDVPSITVDDLGGSAESVEYLISLGHRRIGIVTGGELGMTSQMRLQGYKDTLLRHGIPVREELIKTGNFSQETAKQAVDEFMEMDERPTALFVCNESMTAGALMSLKKHNVRIPEDISLIGWDNPSWAGFMSPGLSVVDQASHTMGVMAFRALLSEMLNEKKMDTDRNLVLKPELVIRDSCRQI